MITQRARRVLVAVTAALGFAAGFLIAQGRAMLAAAIIGGLAFAWVAFAGIATAAARRMAVRRGRDQIMLQPGDAHQ
ncbi:MAG TPA: hypothetical protein VFA04_05665 [Bryobacteraceae bacterium]|nr:hypothetical protein [Bryobacteraceae bacterium]